MRATPKRFIKSLFLCSVMGFLVINLNLFLRADVDENTSISDLQDSAGGGSMVGAGGGGGGGLPIDFMVPDKLPPVPAPVNAAPANRTIQKFIEQDKFRNVVLPPVNDTSRFSADEKYDPKDWLEYREVGTNTADIMAYIKGANRAQAIRNLDKFDLSTSENTIVIVVQVHNRLDYLQALIASLKKAKYIEDALLIFSHDYFDDKLNLLVSSIDFCPVLQIFYPDSIQVHPHEYPGEDPDDCPRDMKREQALQKKCINAEWPDKYGHYREAKYTQTKHHWFWKLNHVFDFLDVTKNFNGPVLLMEEDHYVAEDFIHVLWKMYRFKEQKPSLCKDAPSYAREACKECSIFTIGSYEKHPTYGSFSNRGLWEIIFGGGGGESQKKEDRVEIMNWISSKHNMGMAMNREVWQKIKKCTEQFCRFDDYNWDWSLQYISMTCIPNMLRVMVMKSPRIFHIGECGVHHKGKNGKCDPTDKVKQIETLLTNNKDSLYPDSLAIHGFPKTANRKLKPNGGWGDKRDQDLCLRFTLRDTHR